MKRRIILTILAVLVIAGAVTLVKHRKKQLQSIRVAEIGAIPVETGSVTQKTFVKSRLYYGILASDRRAVIRSRVSGEVTVIAKRESMPVKKGDILIELDGQPGAPVNTRAMLTDSIKNTQQAISDMEKSVKNLKSIYDRDSMLYENGALAKQQMEQSETRWRETRIQLVSMRNEIKGLQEKLQFFTVRSPFDGVVSTVSANEGDTVGPNQPLISIENVSPCKVVATVSAADTAKLKPQTPAVIEYGGQQLECKLTRIHPSADGGVGTVDIQLNTPPFGIRLGTSVAVKIEVERIKNALVVPAHTVLTGVDKCMVFLIKDGKVKIVPVEILAESETELAVKGSLSPGQTVVRGGDSLLMRLSENMNVSAVGESK